LTRNEIDRDQANKESYYGIDRERYTRGGKTEAREREREKETI